MLGEDVGVYGGAFKVTLGFQEEFGAWRVIDTPLSETAIIGGATGAAIMGLRPVAEMQFADFVSCAWDHLVTVAAKQRWRAGTPVPIVLRLPSGGGFSGGPFHSQNPESSFAHIPGLKCVCPATPEDAKGLLIAAIEDPNPVLFFEHKHLYRRIKGEVPDERYTTPIGKARIHAEGEDVTVITWGAMVYTAEEAAQQLPDASVEIVDLRTIMPWDKEAVLDSVRKTSKVLVLHEDTRTGGFGAEIAATIAEEAFEDLDAPVKRHRGARHARAVLAGAREGVHPTGRRRRRRAQGAGRVLMASTGTAVDVVMPQMGVSVSEGTDHQVARSRSASTIEADETLLEISTDKVDTEVPSPGRRHRHRDPRAGGRDGRGRHGARAHRRRGRGAAAAGAGPSRARPAPEPRSRSRAGARADAEPRRSAAAAAAEPRRTGSGRAGRRTARAFVSPVVARIAAEHGIDPTAGAGHRHAAAASRRRTSWPSSRPAAPPASRRRPQAPRRPLRAAAARRTALPPAPPRRLQRAPAAAPAAAPVQPRAGRDRSSRCPRCAAGSPSTCAARSTPPRT